MFLRGNTGVLVMMPVLLIAGMLFQIPELLQHVLGTDFVIHFMLIRDIGAENAMRHFFVVITQKRTA